MIIQLMQGQFKPTEAVEIISQMINIKIKYQESKITASCSEEDIKNRESKIIRLQKELNDAKNSILSKNEELKIDASIIF